METCLMEVNSNVETIKNGFKIILSDKNVKSILINIFGGIVRCDRVANGVIQAVKELELDVVVVVRLQGTNAKLAKKILDEYDKKGVIKYNYVNGKKIKQ